MNRTKRARAAAWTQLVGGLFGFGLAVALMIRSRLGLGPWDVLHVGLHDLTGISVGTAAILVGLLIVAGGRILGMRPGAGTLANMVLVGAFLDLVLPWVPEARGWAWRLAYFGAALPLAGLATGMYIAAGLGEGPRDGLMVALGRRSGWPVRRVRTLIEMSALALGWTMGGPIGVGTVLFTLAIGPSVQWGLRLFGALPEPAPVPAPARPPRGERRKAA